MYLFGGFGAGFWEGGSFIHFHSRPDVVHDSHNSSEFCQRKICTSGDARAIHTYHKHCCKISCLLLSYNLSEQLLPQFPF